jgi:GH15 family glucan-1,4-alpha-glucosidase
VDDWRRTREAIRAAILGQGWNADIGAFTGTFLLCTFWLAEALALAGRTGRARELFERAVAFRNDVDLLAEEVDPATGDLIGNFPQAFSHIGLVNAAWAIARSQREGGRVGPPAQPDRSDPVASPGNGR